MPTSNHTRTNQTAPAANHTSSIVNETDPSSSSSNHSQTKNTTRPANETISQVPTSNHTRTNQTAPGSANETESQVPTSNHTRTNQTAPGSANETESQVSTSNHTRTNQTAPAANHTSSLSTRPILFIIIESLTDKKHNAPANETISQVPTSNHTRTNQTAPAANHTSSIVNETDPSSSSSNHSQTKNTTRSRRETKSQVPTSNRTRTNQTTQAANASRQRVDCEWCGFTPWTTCSQTCSNAFGPGTRSRTVKVLTPARNGGNACPDIVETQACEDNSQCGLYECDPEVDTNCIAVSDCESNGSDEGCLSIGVRRILPIVTHVRPSSFPMINGFGLEIRGEYLDHFCNLASRVKVVVFIGSGKCGNASCFGVRDSSATDASSNISLVAEDCMYAASNATHSIRVSFPDHSGAESRSFSAENTIVGKNSVRFWPQCNPAFQPSPDLKTCLACEETSFSIAGWRCEKCPRNANCSQITTIRTSDGSTVTRTSGRQFPVPNHGFWRDPRAPPGKKFDEFKFHECPYGEPACVLGIDAAHSASVNVTCGEGYKNGSILCAVCEDGFYVKDGEYCAPCASAALSEPVYMN